MGSGQFWCHPASFLVPFLSSFVYTYEQHSDTDYKKQKADEQYYQLVSIHISNPVRDAERRTGGGWVDGVVDGWMVSHIA